MVEVHPEKVIAEMVIKKMSDDTKVLLDLDLRTKRRKSLVLARSHVIEIDREVEITHVTVVAKTVVEMTTHVVEVDLDLARLVDQKRLQFLTYVPESRRMNLKEYLNDMEKLRNVTS